MRTPAPALLVALLCLLPVAAAQVITQPIRGGYGEVYLVAGRAVDERGEPVAGADITVELEQPGVRAAPLKAVTNCKGDFITYFTLRNVTAQGSVGVTVHGRDGLPDAHASARLDPFFRRSDLLVRMGGPWDYRCPEGDVWPVSVSVTGRILNRTEPYDQGGASKLHAEPYRGEPVRLRYTDAEGQQNCPPAQNSPAGVCDFLYVDERGDFRYTFTFDRPIQANGTMHVVIGDQVHSMPVDPETRIAVMLIEATGRGAPSIEEAPAPAPGIPGLLLASAAALVLARRLRR